MSRLLPALCALVAAGALARAEPPAPAGDDDDAPAAATPAPAAPKNSDGNVKLNPNEPYQGVVPGGNALPPRAPKLPLKKGPQRLTWSGFQVRDGVPTVFLEVTGAPDYHVDESAGAITVTLRNTVAPLKNNRRPLRVEEFKTQVKEVESRERGRDLQVTIRTDGNARPSHKERVEPAAGGFQLLVIELGK